MVCALCSWQAVSVTFFRRQVGADQSRIRRTTQDAAGSLAVIMIVIIRSVSTGSTTRSLAAGGTAAVLVHSYKHNIIILQSIK